MKVAFLVLLFSVACFGQETSCTGRCGENNGDPSSCQCNEDCVSYGDCCSDYVDVCSSCSGRCGIDYDEKLPCQCNVDCPSYGNCCDDYSSVCTSGQTLTEFTEELFTLDVNRKSIVYDPNPPGPLFTNKNQDDLTGPTITPFIELRSTYFADTCATETEDMALRDAFLDAVFATSVMTRTEEYMTDSGLLPSQYSNLRECIEDIWFTFFNRCDSSSIDGSNGYEHSLIGEIDNGDVSGYHNWISWYIDEMEGEIEYLSLLGEEIISSDLSIIMVEMNWMDANKPITSMWIGSSPEFELAMYTICFFAKPNALCDVSSNGWAYEIQTYDFSGDPTLVGSAYPNI